MSFVRAVLRSFKLIGYFVWFGTELLIRRPATRPARADWLHRFCASALRGFNIPISVEGAFPERGALVTNHTGYLDIIVLSAIHPCVFVSKEEIRKWPVIGWLATMAGTVFVERGRGGLRSPRPHRASGGLGCGSAGDLLPGRHYDQRDHAPALPRRAVGPGARRRPAITAGFLHYILDHPNPPNVSVEDQVAYWGDANLLIHIFHFLGLNCVHAHVRIAPAPIAFTSDTQHRKTSAREARNAVCALSPIPLAAPAPEPAASLTTAP